MGKTFINKLGSLLRVFKGGKKKESEKSKGDSVITSASESIVKPSANFSSQQVIFPIIPQNLKKSKSIESISTAADTIISNEFNKLKRTNALCDILESTKDDEIKCTKSLHRFCHLEHTNNCIFSYNAKLHDSSIWSQALGRVIKNTGTINNESNTSWTVQNDSDHILQSELVAAIDSSNIEIESDRSNKNGALKGPKINKGTYAKMEHPQITHTHSERITSCVENYGGRFKMEKHSKLTEVFTSSNIRFDEMSQTKPESTELYNLQNSTESNELSRIGIEVGTEFSESQITDKLGPREALTETKSKTKIINLVSSRILIDEQKVQVPMEVKTIKNDEGFDLLKYDMKSAGDHAEEVRSLLENYVNLTNSKHIVADVTDNRNQDFNTSLVRSTSSKLLSGTTTEYEIVNLAQVDLFKEFKTTIANMRKVLNVLEVKKSLQCIIERNEKKVNQCITTQIENVTNGHISTQTATMTYNQISTSTNDGFSSPTKNEGVMVNLSDATSKCRTNSKNITLDSSLFNYIKPLEKIKKRKKYRRVRRCKHEKVMKRTANTLSLDKASKSKTKSEKAQYNKCVVYHITQHKNSTDRCVGTPLASSKKGDFVVRNTFSALHFGPIHEFPVLLDKHENEQNRKTELKFRLKSVDSKRDNRVKAFPRRKSAGLLTREELDPIRENICHKSKTQPSLKTVESKESSVLSNNTTTANWFVFEPSPTLVLQDKQSTSSDLVLDKNRSSTQKLVSRILEEEFKTSGLRGKVSSNTMNLIKDQFCDKLNGINPKDVPDVMITVCVPLKEIVSKMKASRRPSCEDKAIEYECSKRNSVKIIDKSSCDMGVQVNVSRSYVNDNLQTIPEKMCRKPSEIYQQNKQLRESTSFKKLSSFKKLFGNKATSCSNINSLGHAPSKASKIFFSDHSTSAPEVATNQNVLGRKSYSEKNVSTVSRKLTVVPQTRRNELAVATKKQKEGFFLNLPPNRYKKKREQISKLFDGSDSSDLKYFGDPKLLFHVHDSSFYSSSKTDDILNSQKTIPVKKSTSRGTFNTTYFPVQQIASRVNIDVKPKFVSFSDLPTKNEADDEEKDKKSTENQEHRAEVNSKKFKNVNVNTSKVIICMDSATQCDQISTPRLQESEINGGVKRGVEKETYFNCIEEFSIVSIPKVRFEDEVLDSSSNKNVEMKLKDQKLPSKKFKARKKVLKKEDDNTELYSNDRSSTVSLFTETDIIPKRNTKIMKNEEVGEAKILQNDQEVLAKETDGERTEWETMKTINSEAVEIVQNSRESLAEQLDKEKSYRNKPKIMKNEDQSEQVPDERKIQRKKKSDIMLQITSDSKIIQENYQGGNETEVLETSNRRNHKRKISEEVMKADSTQVESHMSLCRKENVLVLTETTNTNNTEQNLTDLMKDIVDMCNTSFVKSRDCIVELTLYNLIKEIITEHCSHLSEQSKLKVESILSNFIKDSKCKANNKDVKIVESALQNLVKEIESNTHMNTKVESNPDCDQENLRKHKIKTEYGRECDEEYDNEHQSRSKSKHRRHKSKRRSRHRENDDVHRDKHRHREDDSKQRSKGHRKHHYDNDDLGKEETEVKYRSVDGKEEYMHLVQRLQELEEVTKQLSAVAHNQQGQSPIAEHLVNENVPFHKYNRVYTTFTDEKTERSPSKKRMKFSMSQLQQSICGGFVKSPLNINYVQTELDNPILPIPRNAPKLPVTKIVINLSNLKLLTRNCASLMSTSVNEPIVITDSTADKQKLMNEVIAYEIEKNRKNKIRHLSHHSIKKIKRRPSSSKSGIRKDKESFTITIHGKDKRSNMELEEDCMNSMKKSNYNMKIKMVRKKKTISSASDQNTSDSHSFKKTKSRHIEMGDLHKITKEYIKKQYKLKNDYLTSNIARDLLENKCNMEQVLKHRANLDLAYQRMTNFCMFRGLLRKDSN